MHTYNFLRLCSLKNSHVFYFNIIFYLFINKSNTHSKLTDGNGLMNYGEHFNSIMLEIVLNTCESIIQFVSFYF